jgi:SAM-dependent methyltransferase
MTWEQAVLWLRSQPDQRELVRACYFDDPLVEAARRYVRSAEWAALRELLPVKAGLALELGAGRGVLSFALATEGWRVVALEPDPSDVVGTGAIGSIAAATSHRVRAVRGTGEDLPFPDQTFDAVVARQVLHHARCLARTCAEARRVLKQAGTFIAAREHVLSRSEDLPRFLDAHPLHWLCGGENALLRREYVDALQRAGITVTRVFNSHGSDVNLHPETMQARKSELARHLGLPSSRLVPSLALQVLGALDRTPGRLYTFVGRRRG